MSIEWGSWDCGKPGVRYSARANDDPTATSTQNLDSEGMYSSNYWMLLGELGRQSEVSKLRFCLLYLARKRLSPIATFVGTSTLAQAVAFSQGLSGKGAMAVEWPCSWGALLVIAAKFGRPGKCG